MTEAHESSEDVRRVEGLSESPQAISIEEVESVAGEVHELIRAGDEHTAWERLRGLHPADIGSIVAGLPRASRDRMLSVMSPDTVAWIFRQMNPIEAGRMGARLGSDALSAVLAQANPLQALAIVRRLPMPKALAIVRRLPMPQALTIVRRLPMPQALTIVRRLPMLRARQATDIPEMPIEVIEDEEALTWQPDTASALMSEQFPTVMVDGRVESALASMRAMDESRDSYTHLFVVDESGRLAGQVSMVELALSDRETPLREISAPVVAAVNPDTHWDECARLRRHYNLSQLPVVDEDNRLIGTILAESLVGAVVEEDTRQMLQVASVAGESADGPILDSVRTRLPWLTVNLGTTFLAAATVALFESTLARVVVLAAFLPVVAGQGGIGGTQTLTLIVRAIALGELVGISARRLLVREAVVGLIHGVLLGVMVAVIAMLWKKNPGLGLVLGLAMLGNMLIAGMVGAGVPLLLRRIGVDPAVASAVLVTTVTDVIGFLLFLGIATAAITLIV